MADIDVSFEFLPPKTPAMAERLWRSVYRLEPLKPTSVSITCGAEQSTRERTHAIVSQILSETSLSPAVHVTCVEATRSEIDDVVRKYWNLGVRHLVALRGDPLAGASQPFRATKGGYENAAALVSGIKAIGAFKIAVACYPEGHPESPSIDADIDMLKAKIDAGATSALTQFFFDNEIFFRFLDRVLAAGIKIPIRPGIVPLLNFHRTARFAGEVGVSVPNWLRYRFENLENDRVTRRFVAASVASEQVLDLVDHGITKFHFFTLNRADLVYSICHLLGLRPSKGVGVNQSIDCSRKNCFPE